LSVLLCFTNSEYLFDIFKLFLNKCIIFIWPNYRIFLNTYPRVLCFRPTNIFPVISLVSSWTLRIAALYIQYVLTKIINVSHIYLFIFEASNSYIVSPRVMCSTVNKSVVDILNSN
jgi:hypothetical protein